MWVEQKGDQQVLQVFEEASETHRDHELTFLPASLLLCRLGHPYH